MRCSLIAGAVFLAGAAMPALAQDTAPPRPINVTGGATVVSEYRFRGISQSNRRPALQGTVTVAHQSGFYATIWGSTIGGYIANGSDEELDLIAGYAHSFASGVKLDGGVLYYYYPGGGHAKTDYFEPYIDVSATYGPVTGKLTANYGPKQDALGVGAGREDNLYVGGDLSSGVPTTPLTVAAHLGHTFGPSNLSIGKGYTDWSLGASATFDHLTLGVSYVDTDKNLYLNRRNLSGAGAVASVGVAF